MSSTSSPPEGSKILTFDDRDLDRIRYNDQWFITGNWNASAVGQSGTLSSSNSATANLTFTFPEPATEFTYWGIPRSGGGFYQICIDCDPNAPNFVDIDALNRTDNGQNPPIVLFSQRFSQPGVHEVILRNSNDTRTGRSQITLDRFELTVPDPDFRPSPSSSLTTTALPTIRTSGAAATPTERSGAARTSQAEIVGTVVGGVVGGIAVLAIGALLLFLCMRKRARRREKLEGGDPSLPMASQRFYGQPVSAGYPTESSVSAYNHTRDQSFSSPGSPPQSVSGHSYGPSSYSGTTRTTARREQDAGIILESDEGSEMPTLPPEYDQVFRRQQALRVLSMSENGSSDTASVPTVLRAGPPRSTSMSKKPLQALDDSTR